MAVACQSFLGIQFFENMIASLVWIYYHINVQKGQLSVLYVLQRDGRQAGR